MPRHFEEPPLFTLLSNTATNLLPSGCAEASLLTLPQQAVQDMIEHVWTLPDDTTGNTDLDMARYWGLAKIMEHFHAAIAGPKRAEVQDRLATTFAARRSADGLYVSSLKPELYPNMFLDIAQASVAELPAAQRLAAEAIDLVARIRLTKRQSRTADDVFPLGHMVHRVTTNTANASALSQNVTAGYLAVLGEALEQKYGGQEPRPNVMIRDERFMRSVGGVARACAGLRIDDFSTRLSQYVVSTPTGIAFNRGLLENVPSVSELEKTNIPKTLHTEAIGCPAKYVRGLIPLVIELVNIALEKADTTEI